LPDDGFSQRLKHVASNKLILPLCRQLLSYKPLPSYFLSLIKFYLIKGQISALRAKKKKVSQSPRFMIEQRYSTSFTSDLLIMTLEHAINS